MNTGTTGDRVAIVYKDWDKGQPTVFSHEWQLSADHWDAQIFFLLGDGDRVIAHYRRGHSCSLALFSETLAQPAGVARKDAA